jgi:hypothetical protein
MRGKLLPGVPAVDEGGHSIRHGQRVPPSPSSALIQLKCAA